MYAPRLDEVGNSLSIMPCHTPMNYIRWTSSTTILSTYWNPHARCSFWKFSVKWVVRLPTVARNVQTSTTTMPRDNQQTAIHQYPSNPPIAKLNGPPHVYLWRPFALEFQASFIRLPARGLVSLPFLIQNSPFLQIQLPIHLSVESIGEHLDMGRLYVLWVRVNRVVDHSHGGKL